MKMMIAGDYSFFLQTLKAAGKIFWISYKLEKLWIIIVPVVVVSEQPQIEQIQISSDKLAQNILLLEMDKISFVACVFLFRQIIWNKIYSCMISLVIHL